MTFTLVLLVHVKIDIDHDTITTGHYCAKAHAAAGSGLACPLRRDSWCNGRCFRILYHHQRHATRRQNVLTVHRITCSAFGLPPRGPR